MLLLVLLILFDVFRGERFSDLNVVCIGCSQGMGRATVQYLSENGANVVACSRSISKFEWVSSPNIYTTSCDAKNITSLQHLLSFSLSKLKNITGLVFIPTAPSKADDDGWFKPFHVADINKVLSSWHNYASFDYAGYLIAVRIFFDELSKTGYGSVISMSSVAAQITPLAFHGGMNYGAIKAAQDFAAKSLAKSYAHIPIRFNAISPGYIESNALDEFPDEMRETFWRNGAYKTPMLRVGNVHEVGRTISFLLSREAEFITGIVLTIDGGAKLTSAFTIDNPFGDFVQSSPDSWDRFQRNPDFDLDSKTLRKKSSEQSKTDLFK